MYGVEDYELIRRAILLEKKSKRFVSREYGYCHETIQKALNFTDKPEYKRIKEIAHQAIEEFKLIIDRWLEEDKSVPRKQRHTDFYEEAYFIDVQKIRIYQNKKSCQDLCENDLHSMMKR